jgi:pimeloyl-ACP methyl ester carboxylesterase
MLFAAICFMAFMAGCSDADHQAVPETPVLQDQVKYEILKEYTFDDLKGVENEFKKEYTGSALEFLSLIDRSVRYEGEARMRVYKVVTESDPPAGKGAKVNLSGLLIAPPFEEGRAYRQVIAPPYTYVLKREAPTVRMADGKPEPHILFWLIAAYNHGYAVMIPDYPGFGDSFGQCYIPYVEREPMVRTTLEFVKAVQSVLKKERYEKKGGFIVSGYSLGAYVSLQLARELETNSGVYKEMPVDFLLTGGSPCNLLQEANLIRASENIPQPYLLPLALLGYKKNGYPHLVMGDYLREPYASEADSRLDGLHEDFDRFFTDRAQDLFTASFLKNERQEEINRILEDNSVKPWKNRCRFIMTHGEGDRTVFYDQARDFAQEQERYGGSVSFNRTGGTHTGAGLWFFLKLYAELNGMD